MHAHYHGAVLVGSSVHTPDANRVARGFWVPYSVVACALLVRMYVVLLTITHTRWRLYAFTLCIGGVRAEASTASMLSEFANTVAKRSACNANGCYKDAVSIAGEIRVVRNPPHMKRSTYMQAYAYMHVRIPPLHTHARAHTRTHTHSLSLTLPLSLSTAYAHACLTDMHVYSTHAHTNTPN